MQLKRKYLPMQPFGAQVESGIDFQRLIKVIGRLFLNQRPGECFCVTAGEGRNKSAYTRRSTDDEADEEHLIAGWEGRSRSRSRRRSLSDK